MPTPFSRLPALGASAKHALGVAAAVVALLLLAAPQAMAHRANIFAWEDGGNIRVECSFSGGKPAMHAPVTVTDAASGEELAKFKTDGEGMGAFPIPDKARANRLDLRLELMAGEGHRGEWIITADEYLGAAPDASSTDAAPETQAAQAAAPASAPAATAAVDKAALKRIVDDALAKRLAPINRHLASLADPAPGIRDIVGGIGWILGLFGIAALVRSRR